MNCRQAQKLLPDYSAGFVEGERRQRLQAHLDACEACGQHLAQLQSLDQLLTADRLAANEALAQGVMAHINEAEILRKWRRRHVLDGLGPTMAALSLGAAATVVMHQHVGQWAAALSTWEVDWELLAQPQCALALAVGLPVVAGLVAWLTNWLAEELT